jgi:hypothetical protein
VLAAGLGAGALVGCGSAATKTVSIAESPAPSSTSSSTSTRTATATATAPARTTATTPTTTAGAGGGTPAPNTTTRSAPEPAFTETAPQGEAVSAAVAVVQARGYMVRNPGEYHPNQTLRVLIGTRTGSSDGYGQRAFFFVEGRYIGTDTKLPSATVRVVSQADTEVVLAYPLYRAGDSLCCPASQALVHFQLDNGQLTPVGQIPPASSTTGYSRN